jgi:hypothetical protein
MQFEYQIEVIVSLRTIFWLFESSMKYMTLGSIQLYSTVAKKKW